MIKMTSVLIAAIIVVLILGVGAYAATGGFSGSNTATPTPTATVTPEPTATATPAPTLTPVSSSTVTATPTVTPVTPTATPDPYQEPPAYWPLYDFNWSAAPVPSPTPAPFVDPVLLTSCDGYCNPDSSVISIKLYVMLKPGSTPLSTDDLNMTVSYWDPGAGLLRWFAKPASDLVSDGSITEFTDSAPVMLTVRNTDLVGSVNYHNVVGVGVLGHIGNNAILNNTHPTWHGLD